MDDREGGIDQVFLLHLFALDDEALQQTEEFHLAAAERGVGADELVKGGADLVREAPEHFNAQDVADELDEARLAVLVDLTQQVFGDVRVLFVQQFGQFVGLFAAHCLAVLDLLQHQVVRGEFSNQVFHHFAVAGDADRLVLWAELHPFLFVQFIGQIEVCLFLAGGSLAELHQRAEFGDQFVEGIFIRLGPVVAGLRGADHSDAKVRSRARQAIRSGRIVTLFLPHGLG